MVKFSFFFSKVIFACVFVFLAANFAEGQNLCGDLGKSFKKYKLTNLNQARSDSNDYKLPINLDNKQYILELTPRDLRAPRYYAETETENGRRRTGEAAVETYRGKIAGDADSQVRLRITNDEIEGWFSTRTDKFFIEPAARYSKFAADGDLVVYKKEDFISPDEFSCGSPLVEKIDNGAKTIAAQQATASSGLRVIEIATEADYEFVTRFGGAAQANAEILAVLNMVEGAYEQELGLSFDVVYQHAWATGDPFNGTNADAMVRSFQSYWNANMTNVSRDVAHVWTSKPTLMAQGYAFLNVICVNPGAAYGMSGFVEWVPAKYDVTAHEIGHNLGANHADDPQGCANTIMNSILSAVTPLTFCTFSRSEVTNYVTGNASCLAPRSSAKTHFDFDGDSKADAAVFRPSTGTWYVARSSGGYDGFQFGQDGDKPVPADYDGDGKTDAAVYRNGNWYILKSSTRAFYGVSFGLSTDVPAPADFDGDGKTDVAVFRPSNGNWYMLKSGSGNAFFAQQFGAEGDIAMPGDFDGDGKADISVWRPANGVWYRINSGTNTFFGVQFGSRGDKPVSGDFDGDGKADPAVYRPSTGFWYILKSASGALYGVQFGNSTDIPAPGDFDGDGRTDAGVFRNGVWHRLTGSSSAYSAVQFGSVGDIPAPSFYLQ